MHDGETYDRKRDGARLGAQARAVFDVMRRGGRWTLGALAVTVNAPEASVSARLRDLRKPRFGGYRVERRHAECGLWEYRLLPPASVGAQVTAFIAGFRMIGRD